MVSTRVVACVTFIWLAGFSAHAAELSGYVTVTSDYVKRGVSQSDEDPALQLSAEIGFENGLYGGVWGSTIDIDNGMGRQRDTEVNYYLGYAHDAGDKWRLFLSTVAYTYPGQSGNVDYDYEEYSFGINYDDFVWLQYSYSPDLYHSGLSSTNVDLYAEWPVSPVWTIGGGGGRYDTTNLTGRSYWYGQFGATASLRFVDIDIRLHDTSRWAPVVSTANRADARLVLTFRIPF